MSRLQTEAIHGATIIAATRPWGESVAGGMFVPCGAGVEPVSQRGASHLVEHLLFRGTLRYPSSQALMAACERQGIVLSASTSRDYLTVGFQAEPESAPVALALVVEMLQEPVFNAEAFEQEQAIVHAELLERSDAPGTVCKEQLRAAIWGSDHPLGRPVGGTPARVLELRYDQVRNLWAQAVAAASPVIVLAGPISLSDMMDVLRAVLRPNTVPAAARVSSHGIRPTPLAVCSRSLASTHVAVGIRVLPPDPQETFVWEVLSAAVGEGESSLLFQRVRQELSLVYDVYSQFRFFKEGGDFLVFFNAPPESAARALQEVVRGLENAQGLPDDAVLIGRARTRAHYRFRLEDPLEFVNWLGHYFMAYHDVCGLSAAIRAISETSAESVRIAASRLQPDNLAISVVGPHDVTDVEHWPAVDQVVTSQRGTGANSGV